MMMLMRIADDVLRLPCPGIPVLRPAVTGPSPARRLPVARPSPGRRLPVARPHLASIDGRHRAIGGGRHRVIVAGWAVNHGSIDESIN